VSANLELVRSIYAEWERGDWSSVDWADPEIDFEMIGGLIEGRWTGVTEMGRVWGAMVNAWENLTANAEEFRELDDERVLVFLTNRGQGRESGIELADITAKSANVFTIRDGNVKRLALYWDRDRAIADLGLD
jgi:ketosteroid isomerase-like protein